LRVPVHTVASRLLKIALNPRGLRNLDRNQGIYLHSNEYLREKGGGG
jgi:hypothetical protein